MKKKYFKGFIQFTKQSKFQGYSQPKTFCKRNGYLFVEKERPDDSDTDYIMRYDEDKPHTSTEKKSYSTGIIIDRLELRRLFEEGCIEIIK